MNVRNRQIIKMYNRMMAAYVFITVSIRPDPKDCLYPGGGIFDIQPDQLETYKAIYGERLVVIE